MKKIYCARGYDTTAAAAVERERARETEAVGYKTKTLVPGVVAERMSFLADGHLRRGFT